jgi:hypothetical protein
MKAIVTKEHLEVLVNLLRSTERERLEVFDGLLTNPVMMKHIVNFILEQKHSSALGPMVDYVKYLNLITWNGQAYVFRVGTSEVTVNPADLQNFILRAKNNGRNGYIDFIKDVRRNTGAGLKDAKDFVDYLTQGFVE